MSEKEIILSCQKGNFDDFSVLYEGYFEQIYKFIFLKTFDKSLAQDITQETFLKALNNIDKFDYKHKNSFKSWIYKIAYNLIIDNYKLENKQVSIEQIAEICCDCDFGEDLDNKEKLKEIFNFFETLNPKHKKILIMRFWDDLSYKEISELTGENLDNCKKIVSRSLSKIPKDFVGLLFILLIF